MVRDGGAARAGGDMPTPTPTFMFFHFLSNRAETLPAIWSTYCEL